MKRKPDKVYLLFDINGENCGAYDSPEEAKADAWGPRFSSFEIVVYLKSKGKDYNATRRNR